MIGVVGPDEEAARLAEAVSGAEVGTGGAADLLAAGPEFVVAVGDEAVRALVRAGVDVPVLPVDVDRGLVPVTAERAPTVIDRMVADGFVTLGHPVLSVAVDGDPVGRALFDAMLVTSEPARISEYAVESPGGTDAFRADGVVIATPAGSRGYARAVGGPVVDPGSTALAVVPVAAFAIRASSRVSSADATLTVSVERDEGAISLLVDGEERRGVPPRRPVTVSADDTLETAVPPEGRAGRLEKL